jgi:hypothetical protein
MNNSAPKKNKAAQQLQKLSRLAQIKRLGSEEKYREDLVSRFVKKLDKKAVKVAK